MILTALAVTCMQNGDVQTPFEAALTASGTTALRYLAQHYCDLSRQRYLFPPHHNDANDDDERAPQVLRDDPELLDFLRGRARNPQPLLQCCMRTIRRHFRQDDLFWSDMRYLELPQSLVSRLFYETYPSKT